MPIEPTGGSLLHADSHPDEAYLLALLFSQKYRALKSQGQDFSDNGRSARDRTRNPRSGFSLQLLGRICGEFRDPAAFSHVHRRIFLHIPRPQHRTLGQFSLRTVPFSWPATRGRVPELVDTTSFVGSAFMLPYSHLSTDIRDSANLCAAKSEFGLSTEAESLSGLHSIWQVSSKDPFIRYVYEYLVLFLSKAPYRLLAR